MAVCLRLHTWVGIGVLCALAIGCSRPSSDFLGARAADFGDCIEATLGAGGPIHVRLKFTDHFVMAIGYAHAHRNGWHGYRGGRSNWYGDLQILGGLPFIYNREEVRRLGNDDEPHSTAVTWSPFATNRRYARDDDDVLLLEPHPSDPYWCGLSLTRFISFTLGFNLAEFGDFVAGWFGGDPRGDDAIEPLGQGALAGASRQTAEGSLP